MSILFCWFSGLDIMINRDSRGHLKPAAHEAMLQELQMLLMETTQILIQTLQNLLQQKIL